MKCCRKKKLKESGEKKEKQSKGKKKETNEEEKPKDPEKVDDNQPTEKSKGGWMLFNDYRGMLVHMQRWKVWEAVLS